MSLFIKREEPKPVAPLPIKSLSVGSRSRGASFIEHAKSEQMLTLWACRPSQSTIFIEVKSNASSVCFYRDEFIEWCKAAIELLEEK